MRVVADLVFIFKSFKLRPKQYTLLLLAAVIGFSTTMPNQVMALGLENLKMQPKAQSVANSPKVDYTKGVPTTDTPHGSGTTDSKVDRTYDHEDASKRSTFTSTYVNKDGTKTFNFSQNQQNFKDKDNRWQKIDNSLTAIRPPAQQKLWQSILNVAPEPAPIEFTGKAGVMSSRMKALADGLVINVNDKTFTMKPVGANNVTPEQLDDQTVVYRDAWPNVDLQYELRGESIKEIIVLKSRSARTDFNFTVDGGTVIQHPTKTGQLTIAGTPEDFSFSSLTLDVNGRGVISEERVKQSLSDGGIKISMDKDWMVSQPSDAFPMRIDPTFYKDASDYGMYKSDGYNCNASNCYANTGTINDGGWWKYWRTYFKVDYSSLMGKHIVNANLHGTFKSGVGGTTTNRWLYMGQAPDAYCFDCFGNTVAATTATTDFNMDFTTALQNRVNGSQSITLWSLAGEESNFATYKPYSNLSGTIIYDNPTSVSVPTDPANQQVVVSTQPTLRVNAATDPDGDAIQYYYRVATSSDGESGAVINSGWISGTQWTVPDGVLQDGTTYYWRVYTKGATTTNPNWVRSFKVDLRTGKDSTQAYETVGPMGIDLATGNTTTSTETHSMSALGGNIGLSLNYNTPTQAKRGLSASYWNVSNGYLFTNGTPTGTADVSRNEQNINNDWGAGGPQDGAINNTWYYAQYSGYFVAPNAGTYQFGGVRDGSMSINVNGTDFGGGCSGSTACYNSNTVSLTAGQVVPITVNYEHGTGSSYVKVYVKGGVTEQVISSDWLRTGVTPTLSQYGLKGRYYTDDGSHTFPGNDSDPNRFMLSRQDSNMSLNWGAGGPAPGLQGDNFMAKWTGYLSVPTTGSYTFGANTDDGIKIAINGNTVLNSWQDQNTILWGSSINLTANQPVPITVEYFEHAGNATMTLLGHGPGLSAANDVTAVIPAKWLTPVANALPDAWKLGVSVDGSVGYERLRTTTNSVILEDSTRSTHEYTWTGSGYKPPINEDGQLMRNADNTYTFTDTDGRVYIFDAEGKLVSLTSPSDDQQPAALKYTYSGSPSRLTGVTDGVTNSRYASIYYAGVNDNSTVCPLLGGFDATPSGMLCAAQTSDGDITHFYYSNGQLSRIVKPGNEQTDYWYDTLGRIIATRDSVANDAIAASVRADDNNVKTELTYDVIGRVSTITAPAATTNAARIIHSFEYLPGATQLHISGAPEPSGFSKRIEYDSLLRTTKEADVANLMTYKEWNPIKDLELSSTDATGLKSTTIYDDEDRPIENYGPVPASWYGTDNKPLSAYASQVPKTTATYDEGMMGLAVAYSNSSATSPRSSINGGYTMMPGDTLTSIDQRFRLVYQTDSNLKIYTQDGTNLWSSNTGGQASTRLFLQYDGNLVLFNGGTGIWSTGGTSGSGTARLEMQNDGNLVITRPNGSYWHTSTGGYSAATSSNVSLTGAPILHSTNIASDGSITRDFTSNPALTNQTSGWGMSLTGKMRLPTTGNWNFRIFADNGVRVWIDDKLVLDNWIYAGGRSLPLFSFNNTTANSVHRVKIDYFHAPSTPWAGFYLYATPPGGSETTNIAQYFSPGYSLKTSETAYDSQLGNVTTTTTYAKPEYGIVDKTTLNPTGLNLQTSATYESPGIGFLRQTSKTLPGGGTTTYQHYSATDTKDNPCTVQTESIHQGGRPKGKVEADPDGVGLQVGRTSETIYNEAGDVVANRYNNDNWTCTAYDARGRVLSTIIPALGSKPTRTITNDFAKDGNPLVTTTTDNSGTIRVENDLLGRTLKYIDAKGKVTENTYDIYGKLTGRTSPVGTEAYEYDNFDRLIVQKLDGVTFATVTYDAYSRIATVQYPAGISLSSVTRDTLGRENSTAFTVNSQTYTDSIERYTSGDIKQGTENGTTKAYTYDNAGRLTGAIMGSNTFAYEFGTPDSSCSGVPGYNANAAKNGNRTKMTVNGVVSTYCYDLADRLISSSDATLTNAQYDSRGNTTSLGDSTHKTEFVYDVSDRNTGIKSESKETVFTRDVQDRIVGREHKENGNTTSSVGYGFTGSGDSPDFLLDDGGNVTQKYLSLAGDVIVTIKPGSTSAGATTFSLPNIHGDIFLTVDADGVVRSAHKTGPFGEMLPGQTNPANTATGTSWNYVGQHQKLTDTDTSIITGGIMQMGARLYIPLLGRFLTVDPVEGGTANAYVYVNDPVNESDLDGRAGWFEGIRKNVQNAAKWAWQNRETIALVGSVALMVVPGVGPAVAVARVAVLAQKGVVAAKMGGLAVRAAGSAGGKGAGKVFTETVKRVARAKSTSCQFCSKTAREVDHVVPRSKGGNNTSRNAQILCRTCNASKGAGNFPKNLPVHKKITWTISRIFRR